MSQSADSISKEENFRITKIIVPLIAIITGVFMVVLDSTAMNVALQTLVKEFDSDLPTLQWAVTGYMLAQAAVIPLAGWLSDRFGAKTIFLTAIGLFTIGSLLCATPSNSELLIAFRVIQGLGGGFVLPVSMAYVYRLSPPSKVGLVMGMMGIPVLFAPAIGPVLAGWLVEYHSWRLIFLINLPIGIISILIGIFSLPVIEKTAVTKIDWKGMILAPLAFASLSYGVNQGTESWTSTETIVGISVGLIALITFIFVELGQKYPLLELRVFKSPHFGLGILVQWIGQFALFGVIFLLPQFLQEVRGFEPFETGKTLIPQAIASAIVMPIGGWLFDKIGARWLVVIGLGSVSAAIYQYSHVDLSTMSSDLIVPLAMAGAGVGLMMMPLNTYLFNMAPRHLVSRVTSLTNAFQQVINSLSVATLVTIVTTKTESNIEGLQEQAALENVSGNQVDPNVIQQAMGEAAANGFADTFHIMMYVAIGGAILGLLLRRSNAPKELKK